MTIEINPPASKKKKKDVFRILFYSMIAFGIAMGVVFPPFEKLYFNNPDPISVQFGLMCMTAGIIVGLANYVIFSLIISKELRYLVKGMNSVNEQIKTALLTNRPGGDKFEVAVRSNDMLGEVCHAFNIMGATISDRFEHEARFREIVSTLSGNVDLETTSQNILTYFVDSTCITSAVLYGLKGKEMVLLASHDIDTGSNLPRKLEPSWQGLINDADISGKIHTIDTRKEGLDWITITTPLGTLQPQRLRFIPLIEDKSTVGLIIANCIRDDNQPESTQLATLETFARYMAPYLQNALLHSKIQEMASYDALTRVLNRRFGLIRLHEEFSTALRHKTNLSVLMLDIDRFKNVNDSYGHEAGDLVLSKVAETIEENLRNEEVICRYGGEEFLVILPLADLNKASLAADRLRQQIGNMSIYYRDEKILVTASIGVACLGAMESPSENDLINNADAALYYAKNSGRNQVALFKESGPMLLARKS